MKRSLRLSAAALAALGVLLVGCEVDDGGTDVDTDTPTDDPIDDTDDADTDDADDADDQG